ncbi:MAG: type II toxin-antitoxin system YafQ family toxin [bacterium]
MRDRKLRSSAQFRRDLKQEKKRGRDLDRLWLVVELILEDGAIPPPRYRPHMLVGPWAGYYECHIQPDWVMIWRVDSEGPVFERLGTHAELFNK